MVSLNYSLGVCLLSQAFNALRWCVSVGRRCASVLFTSPHQADGPQISWFIALEKNAKTNKKKKTLPVSATETQQMSSWICFYFRPGITQSDDNVCGHDGKRKRPLVVWNIPTVLKCNSWTTSDVCFFFVYLLLGNGRTLSSQLFSPLYTAALLCLLVYITYILHIAFSQRRLWACLRCNSAYVRHCCLSVSPFWHLTADLWPLTTTRSFPSVQRLLPRCLFFVGSSSADLEMILQFYSKCHGY